MDVSISEQVVVEGFRLARHAGLRKMTLSVERERSAGAVHPVSLRFVPERLRLSVRMEMLPTCRTIDVSRQPSLLVRALDGDAVTGERFAVVGGWLRWCAESSGAWHPDRATDPDSLLRLTGGAAFPLLGAAYERGAEPTQSVPTWAAPILRHATARAAASAAFGLKATRPVIKALARSLVSSSPVSLTPFALALIGAAILEPDQLARLLLFDRPSQQAITVEQLRSCQALVAWLGPTRGERVLAEGSRNLPMLFETATIYIDVKHLLPSHPAAGLDGLRTQLLQYMPRQTAVPPHPPHATRRPVAPPVDGFRQAAYRPPDANPAVDRRFPICYPPDIRRQQGVIIGRLRLVLPHTARELDVWGERMGSCISSFTTAIASGPSWLMGVEESDRLVYCLEITPYRTLRQFLGIRNHAVPLADATRIVSHLAIENVLDRTDPTNRLWLENRRVQGH